MNNPVKLVIFSLILLIALGGLLFIGEEQGDAPGTTLMMYCAAGMKVPVEAIARKYEEEYGVHVQLQFGGSGTLLSNMEVADQGDLYLAADTTFIDIAREKGLVDESMALANLRPVLAVPSGNPKGIASLGDLAKKDLRISLANPSAASVGKVTEKMLTQAGIWEAVEASTTKNGVFKPTVNDVANDVKIGAVDVGIVWDAVAAQYDTLEAIALPEAEAFTQRTTVAVMHSTENPTAALRFARYLSAKDRGLPIFAANHFPPAAGDAWALTPEILYYSGGVNRVAIEKTLAQFQAREGIAITTVYNGCGILVGQIKTGETPDVYHTCDASFMSGVEDRFGAVDAVSRTAIVIATQKGNPRGITDLASLAGEGLLLGVCNEDASTLGALTADMLRKEGLYDGVSTNVVTTTPTADLLVSQLTVGKLDAAIVYLANTTYVADEIEIIPIDNPDAMATQTYTVSKNTPYPNLLQRLHHAIRKAESQQLFSQAGFEFLGAPDS